MSQIAVKAGHVYRFHWNAGSVSIRVENVEDSIAEGYTVGLLSGQPGHKFSYKSGWASVDLERVISFEYWCPGDEDHALGRTTPFELGYE